MNRPAATARSYTSQTEKRQSGRRRSSTARSQARALTVIAASGGKRPRPPGPRGIVQGPAVFGPAPTPLVDGIAVEAALRGNLLMRKGGMRREGDGEPRAAHGAEGSRVLAGEPAGFGELLLGELGLVNRLG